MYEAYRMSARSLRSRLSKLTLGLMRNKAASPCSCGSPKRRKGTLKNIDCQRGLLQQVSIIPSGLVVADALVHNTGLLGVGETMSQKNEKRKVFRKKVLTLAPERSHECQGEQTQQQVL